MVQPEKVADKTKLSGDESQFAQLCHEAKIEKKLVVLGGGNMGSALIKGFLKAGLFDCNDIVVTARREETLDTFRREQFVLTSTNNAQALAMGERGIALIAVKPYMLNDLAGQCARQLRKMKMIISVLAGVRLEDISKALDLDLMASNERPIIVRAMPNTPCLIGSGTVGFVVEGGACGEKDRNAARLVQQLFECVGFSCELANESQIDAVCGLSGSGTAYVLTMIEAMSDGGVKMGLPRDLSTRLAAQCLLGTSKMVVRTGEHPACLRDAVCSPGGTTIAGMHMLESKGFRDACISAVEAATKRAQELGKGN